MAAFEEELAERPLLQSILVMETEDLELLEAFLIVDAAREVLKHQVKRLGRCAG